METENNKPYESDIITGDYLGPVKKSENKKEFKQVSVDQQILIAKILRSSKLKDAEYRMLRNIIDTRITSSYDASVLINYVLGLLKFRRHFFNGRHKAYKKCYFCSLRDNVQRYLDVPNNTKAWLCETCAINLDPSKVVPVKIKE